MLSRAITRLGGDKRLTDELRDQLLGSVRRVLRFTRLGTEIGTLQARRKELVKSVRRVTDNYADPTIRRLFDAGDFRSS